MASAILSLYLNDSQLMWIEKHSEGEHMKKILFQKRIDLNKRQKKFSIFTKTEDRECKTRVRKGFTYYVDWAEVSEPVSKPPLVFIRKTFDSKKGIERFSFHVKGYFYASHDRKMVRVRFHHTLDIEIKWKIKDFSPKKSASLT